MGSRLCRILVQALILPVTLVAQVPVGDYHQHLFSARLDMMLDGLTNAVDELDIARVPMGPGNPYGNAFTVKT